jgi:hypothetical protein
MATLSSIFSPAEMAGYMHMLAVNLIMIHKPKTYRMAHDRLNQVMDISNCLQSKNALPMGRLHDVVAGNLDDTSKTTVAERLHPFTFQMKKEDEGRHVENAQANFDTSRRHTEERRV